MTISQPLRVLALAGSLRKESYNKKALLCAATIAREQGATVTVAGNDALLLPLFNEDERTLPFPLPVQHLKDMIEWADVLLIATPEYNHSLPGVLKNAIDWASDKTNPFEGKIAAIFGASIGINGTLRAQLHLRQILTALGVYVVEQPQVFIRNAANAFTPEGELIDKKTEQLLAQLVGRALTVAERLRGMQG